MYFYILTPQGIEVKTRISLRLLQRRLEENEALKAEIEELMRVGVVESENFASVWQH